MYLPVSTLVGYASEIVLADPRLSRFTGEELVYAASAVVEGKREMPVPELRLRNKFGVEKKRRLYVHEPYDNAVMRILNQYISALNLELHDRCYSFRKSLSIGHAVEAMRCRYSKQMVAIKIDITDYFNSINVDALMDALPPAIAADKLTVHFLRRYLGCKGSESLTQTGSEGRGVMAGTPLAPTLSNVYLTDLDRAASQRFLGYARYSDDILVFTERNDVASTIQFFDGWLLSKGLEINRFKTQVFDEGAGWTFLGFHFDGINTDVSTVARKKIVSKVSRIARSSVTQPSGCREHGMAQLAPLIERLQLRIYGGSDEERTTWARWYFPVISTTASLSLIDAAIQRNLRWSVTGRNSKMNFKTVPYSVMVGHGYIPLVSAYYDAEKVERYTHLHRNDSAF